MKKKETKNNSKEKRSNQGIKSVALLNVLKRIFEDTGGTVSYIFLSERMRFTEENPLGEVYYTKSMTHAPINPEVFYKDNDKRERRSYEEILHIFDTTCNDMGANSFILD